MKNMYHHSNKQTTVTVISQYASISKCLAANIGPLGGFILLLATAVVNDHMSGLRVFRYMYHQPIAVGASHVLYTNCIK